MLEHGFVGSRMHEIRDKFKELTSIPGCQPVHVNGLFRHGTRYPGAKDANRVEAALVKIRSSNIDKELLSN